MTHEVPFWILKKVIVIHDTGYKYTIDDDGNGIAYIDDHRILFEVNEYGEIIVESIHYMC